MHTSRRQFMIGCSTAIAAMAGSRLVNLAWAAPGEAGGPGQDRMLVVIFLRGGMDGLQLLAPVDDNDYIAARPQELRVTDSGDNTGLSIGNGPANLDFRLNKLAAPLKELYDGRQLAFVHACGLTDGTRSHFEAMDLMERGVISGSRRNLSSGWLTRYLEDARIGGGDGILPAISGGGSIPGSLIGFGDAMPIPNAPDFRFAGAPEQLEALRKIYSGQHPLQVAGARALRAFDIVQSKIAKNGDGQPLPYEPENGANYGDSEIGRSLRSVAQLIKMDLGLRVATVDYGGWDTHEYQPGHFPPLLEQLSLALGAFYNDVSRYHDRLNVVVMSEFGRRLKSNLSGGTDHGHGNVMMVLGGGVQGGKIYGAWPGLSNDQLDNHADLAVTTDFRCVLAELLTARFGLPGVANVFPELEAYQAPGVFAAST